MEENISRFVTAIIAIFILFIFPVYTAYEKKDDISYALAVRYTQDFVDNVRRKGYITQELYQDYAKSLLATGNTYSIELEHEYVRYDGDYVDKTVGTATRNTELFTNDHILNILDNGQVYTMNVNDNFNVKIKNTNVTLATVIYNIVTVNTSSNNVRIYVDYGGKILAEKWYEQALLYSEYGGIVEEIDKALKINVSIDWDKEVDEDEIGGIVDDDIITESGITNPANLLANRVKVGDYVEYYPDGDKSAQTWNGKYSIHSTFYADFTRYNDIKWRVLKIDGNKVYLTNASNASNSFALNIFYSSRLFGKPPAYTDYANQVINGLKSVCETLYSNSLLGTARMATPKDFDNAGFLKNIGSSYPYASFVYSTQMHTNYSASGENFHYLAVIKWNNGSNDIVFNNWQVKNSSEFVGTSSSNSLTSFSTLRPVVELNENVVIDYTSGGCKDSNNPCGTVNNPWTLLNTETRTLGNVAQVGDYVGYVPDANEDGTAKSVTLTNKVTGYKSDQTIVQKYVNWRVLENDGDKVTLISDDITNYEKSGNSSSSDTGGLYLTGQAGFNNAIDIIDNICGTLYSKKGVAVARSVNESDLKKYGFVDNSISTIEELTYIKHDNNNQEAELKLNLYPSRLDLSSYVGSSVSKALNWGTKALGYYIIDEPAVLLNAGNTKKVVVTELYNENREAKNWNRYYYQTPKQLLSQKNNPIYLLCFDSSNESIIYWLPKIQISYANDSTQNEYYFVICYVNSYTRGSYYNGFVNSGTSARHAIRAIVELDASLLINGNNSGNGSTSRPWILY